MGTVSRDSVAANWRWGIASYALTFVIGLAQLCSAAFFALAARGLGPTVLGGQLTLLSLVIATVSIMEFGCNARAVRRIAQQETSNEVVSGEMFGKTLLTALGLSLVAVGAAFVVKTSLNVAVLAIAYGALLQQTQSSQSQLRANGRLRLSVLTVLVDKALALSVLLVSLALGTLAPAKLWLALICGVMVSSGLGFRGLRLVFSDLRMRNPYAQGVAFGVASTATGLQPLDVAITGLVGGPHLAGIYGAVSRWTAPLMLLPITIGQNEAPRIAGAADNRAAWRFVRRGAILIAPSVIASLVIVVFARRVVAIMLGPEYATATDPFRILVMSVVLGGFGQLLVSYLQGRHQERAAAAILLSVVVVQMLLMALASVEGSAVAVSGCVALAQGSMSIGMYVVSRRTIRSDDPALPHNKISEPMC